MHDDLVRELNELIAALDRRLPCETRAGEASIASEAAALKAQALKQIAQLRDDTHDVVRCPASEQQTATAG